MKTLKNFVLVQSFLLPAVIVYALFMVYPIFETVRLSFFDWSGAATAMNFIGLDNYTNALNDKIFLMSIVHNIIWVVMELILLVIPVLVLAILISKVKKGKLFFRTGFYLPAVLSLPVVAVIWSKIYDPYIGPINAFLKGVHLDSLALNWLGESLTVLPALILASSWVAYGFYMILYMAGLQGIDYSLYEAAEIDGAKAFSKLWHITIPSLRNIMNLVISLVVIHSFKGFALVWIITQGGPFYKSETVATYVYKAAFSKYQISYGAAGSIVLAVIIITVTIVFNRIRERGDA